MVALFFLYTQSLLIFEGKIKPIGVICVCAVIKKCEVVVFEQFLIPAIECVFCEGLTRPREIPNYEQYCDAVGGSQDVVSGRLWDRQF